MTASQQDVMLALLSLDAYSRGGNSQFLNTDGTALDEQIGLIEWTGDSDSIAGATTAGFSASSYSLSDGKTVISYRGTDFNFETTSGAVGTFADILSGWLSSFGVFGSDVLQVKLQPYYAEEFYKQVTNRDLNSGDAIDPAGAVLNNVIITGHSLGGSLAGYIGSLSHSETTIFNEIPYLGLALTTAINEFLGPLTDPTDIQNVTNQLIDLFEGGSGVLTGFNLPTADNITSFRVFGEVAEAARIFGPFLGGVASLYMPSLVAQPELVAAAALIYGATADYQQTLNYLSSNGGLRNPIDLHSQALMVALTFADSEGHIAWQSVGGDLLDALFSSDVALAIGANEFGGYGTVAAKLMDIIAYSVLDEGNLVFGNTGIRALFNDADELGSAVSDGSLSQTLNAALPGLAQAIVQFAGLMAKREVDYHDYQGPGSLFDPLEGIIQLSDADGNETSIGAEATILTLNINQDLWNLNSPEGAPSTIEILGIKTIVDDLLDEASDSAGANTLDIAMQYLYWDTTETYSSTSTLNSVAFHLSEGPLDLSLVESDLAFDTHHASLIALTDDADIVHGNEQNNIIAGADGNDTLYGGLGSDLLVGGNGNDLFIDSVTQRSDDGRQNETDVYVGSNEYTSIWDNFLQWVTYGTETDTVRYTVDRFSADDPETEIDESALQKEGVTITELSTKILGTSQVVEISVQDNNTALPGTDILIGIERVELTERADIFKVTDAALNVAIEIDMGKSGRVQSELPEGETLFDNAFTVSVDTVDYSGIEHGLIYIKGVTHDHQDVSLDHVFTTEGLSEELESILDFSLKGILGKNDALHVENADKVVLTDHDDVLISSDFGSIVYTGDGDDKVYFQDGVAIADLSDDDRISLMGVFTLYGGLKNGWSESPWAWGPYGTAYGLNAEGELVISNVFWQVTHKDDDGTLTTDAASTYVLNFADTLRDVEGGGQIGAGHIFLLEYKLQAVLFRDITQDQIGKASAVGEGAFDLIGWMIKTMTGKSWYGGEDPLVLDLDGDGIELTALDHAKSRYDIDGDLYAEATGFVGGDDGILARDINGNGLIDSSSEMFGQGQTSGFEILKVLDGNLDGVVDANDNALADFNGDGIVDSNDTFDKLLIWKDADEDVHTDVGELKSVSEWGITSFTIPSVIVAPGAAENPDIINGNIVNQLGSYTTSDGLSHTVADVTLKVENQNTTYVGEEIEISEDVVDLADLKGYGTLVSLHEAMSVRPDSETEVRDAVATLTTPDLDQLRALIQPVLQAWALGSPIKIDGVVQTGVMSRVDYDDMVFISGSAGVIDYTTKIEGAGGSYLLTFASGASLNVTLSDYSAEMTDDQVQGALRSLLNSIFLPSSEATVLTWADTNGVAYAFQTDDGTVGLGGADSTTWIHTIAVEPSHQLAEGNDFSGVSAKEFAFYERVMGESLEPFFETPDDAAAGNAALKALLSKMDTVLNTFAVRIAVQSGPLAAYFDTVDYDVVNNGFVSEAGHRISDVFHALLVEAETETNPVEWLSEWKPFMDVFFADYSRGNSNLPVSYGYLAQQMMNAVERDTGGISVENYADAFGFPEDLLLGGAGTLNGRGIEDIILIDGDEVLVRGGSGSDNYIIGKNFGSVEIYDLDAPLAHDFDTLRFSDHNADDIVATRDGIDLLLTDATTGQTIRVTNEFEGRTPGPTIDDASFDYGIDQIVFGDGAVWSKTEIALAVSRVDNNATTVVGTEDIDVLQGGHGNDRLEGGGDTDIYRYSFGDGSDTIFELENNAFRNDNDMLQFLDGIRISDLLFVRENDGADLIIKLKGHPGDQITIEGLFNATYTGVFGNWYQNRIEMFTFDDGSSLSFNQLASLVLNTYSTSGDDQLYGMNREDVLVARKGNDYVSGGNESDTYVFNRGDGQDIYQDRMTNIISGSDDALVFGSGITSENIIFSRIAGDNNTLLLSIAGTNDSVTLLNEYASVYASVYGVLFFDQIESVHFHDQPTTIWTAADMASLALQAEKTSGNETIYGFDIDDVIDGGAGNDFLSGGNGNDQYVWGAGYGHDTIQEGGEDIILGGDFDTVIFQGGLNIDDIAVSRNTDASDLVITIISTGETLTLHDQVGYTSINYHPDMVDRFQFADGTVWTDADLRARYLTDAVTDGNDTIVGFYSNDTLTGDAGNDVLQGGDGSDTYLFGYGSGNDVVEEIWNNVLYSEDDKVVFGPGIARSDVTFARIGNTSDLLITLTSTGETLKIIGEFYTGYFDMNDIERFTFADGTTVTEDDLRALLLTSTSANETVYGFDKSDVFHYGAAGGNDTFIDGVNSGSQDRIVLDDLLQTDVTFSRDVNDLIIVVSPASGGGTIRLTNSLNDYVDEGIELVEFSNGSVLTRADLRALALSGSATTGNDTIAGTSANDVIQGGLGNDVIDGGQGSDTYIYVRGDGNDTITENGYFSNAQDKLVLNGVDPSSVSFERSGGNLVLVIAETSLGAADGGRIALFGNGDVSYDSGIETVIFDDGTTWNANQIRTHYFNDIATAGADTIIGFNTDDTITAGAGNDVINGSAGSDTYHYTLGDGNDTITEDGYFSNAQDRLMVHGVGSGVVSFDVNGENLVLVIPESTVGASDGGHITLMGTGSPSYDSGIESIVFDDGTAWSQAQMKAHYFNDAATAGNDIITGFSTNDTITGGHGDDSLAGGIGNDTYIYQRGDGNDTITDTAGTSDSLVFSDIASTAVSFSKDSSNLIISISPTTPSAGNGGMIKVSGIPVNGNDQGVELVTFSDGVTLSKTDIIAQLSVISGTAGNDTITGSSANDSIAGRGGDDILNGGTLGGGDDTYLYARGDGNDTIIEAAGSYADQVKFSNINASDVSLVRNGIDLTLAIAASSAGAGNGGSILIKQTLDDYYGQGIEKVVFADNTFWTITQMRQMVIDQAGTAGNDTIIGLNTIDTIIGRAGDDTLNGGNLGGNDDTYLYARGDGNDTITEAAGSYNDQLKLTNISASDVTLARSGIDLRVLVSESSSGVGDSGSILIKQTLDDYYGQGIEKLVFANGTQWTITQMRQMVLDQAGTSGNDTIVGFNTVDTITGGAGDDTLDGGVLGGGDDTYKYARGDGNDTIIEAAGSYNDQLKFTNINASDVTLVRNGIDLSVLVSEGSPGAGNDGSILVKQTLDDYFGRGIEKLAFADGTNWNRADILSHIAYVGGTSGNETITGTTGNDTIMAGTGNDTLVGGGGNDTFVFHAGFGNDVLTDFLAGSGAGDIIQFDSAMFADYASVIAASSQIGGDILIAAGGSNAITLKNISLATLNADDFAFV